MPELTPCPDLPPTPEAWSRGETSLGREASEAGQHDVAKPWESVHHMVSSVAHGVKNPLGVLLMGTEYLEKKAPRGDPTAARVAEDMRNAITRADAIVRALLDFSAAENPDRQEEDFTTVVEASLARFESEREEKRIVVVRQFAADLPRIRIDRRQCQRAITHLLSNALTASPPHGNITVQIFSTSDAPSGMQLLHLVIKDEGKGLPATVLKRAFEPFFTTNQGGASAGLGLVVARGIFHAHGGRISLTNRDSGGAQVSVTLTAGCRKYGQGISRADPLVSIPDESGECALQSSAAYPN